MKLPGVPYTPRYTTTETTLGIVLAVALHVVPPGDSDYLASQVSGPVERVSCDRSYHVATLDYDKDMIIERSLDFIAKVTGAS